MLISMNGDKKHISDDLSEILYKASLKKPFKDKVQEIRTEFNIPPKGFVSKKEVDLWYSKLGQSWPMHENFYARIEQLPLVKELQLSASAILADYILSNGTFKIFNSTPYYYSCDFEEVSPSKKVNTVLENRWKQFGQPFIRVYIPRNAGQPAVHEFIKTHWRLFQGIHFRKAEYAKSERRTSSDDKKIINEIERCWKLPRETLGLIKGEKREDGIARLINSKFKKSLSPEAVRQRHRRYRAKGDN